MFTIRLLRIGNRPCIMESSEITEGNAVRQLKQKKLVRTVSILLAVLIVLGVLATAITPFIGF